MQAADVFVASLPSSSSSPSSCPSSNSSQASDHVPWPQTRLSVGKDCASKWMRVWKARVRRIRRYHCVVLFAARGHRQSSRWIFPGSRHKQMVQTLRSRGLSRDSCTRLTPHARNTEKLITNAGTMCATSCARERKLAGGCEKRRIPQDKACSRLRDQMASPESCCWWAPHCRFSSILQTLARGRDCGTLRKLQETVKIAHVEVEFF